MIVNITNKSKRQYVFSIQLTVTRYGNIFLYKNNFGKKVKLFP